MPSERCKLSGKLIRLINLEKPPELLAGLGEEPRPAKTDEQRLDPETRMFLDVAKLEEEATEEDNCHSIEMKQRPRVIEVDKVEKHRIIDILVIVQLLLNIFSLRFLRIIISFHYICPSIAYILMSYQNIAVTESKITAKNLKSTFSCHVLQHLDGKENKLKGCRALLTFSAKQFLVCLLFR